MNASARSWIATSVMEGREPDVLDAVRAPGIGAAVWRRQPAQTFRLWIDALASAELPRLRTLATPGVIETVVQAACDVAEAAPHPERDRLASDIAALAAMLWRIAPSPLVAVRLGPADCAMGDRRWSDQAAWRLICAYRGAGLSLVTISGAASAQAQLLRPGDVALLRGPEWVSCALASTTPSAEPTEAAAEADLLLVLEPAGAA